MLFRRLLCLVGLLMLMGCMVLQHPHPGVSYTHNDPPQVRTVVCPVFTQGTFSEDQLDQIQAALNDWNVALNGYYRFEPNGLPDGGLPEMVSYQQAFGPERLALYIARISYKDVSPGTLGYFSNEDSEIHLVADMLGEDSGTRFRTVAMHEIGHFLGLDHVSAGYWGGPKTLMYPTYTHQPDCVDRHTIEMLSIAHEWDDAHMNWCLL